MRTLGENDMNPFANISYSIVISPVLVKIMGIQGTVPNLRGKRLPP
jgi:hypothetical protein